MRIISRTVLLLLIILAAPITGSLILKNWTAVMHTGIPNFLTPEWLARYETRYLFWSGVFLTFVLVLLLIVVFWGPRPKAFYLYQKSAGQVTVSKKAIEGFTLMAIQQEPFIGNPKVSAKLLRNRIILKVSGNLLSTKNAKSQAESFLNQIEDDLRTCLGISAHKKIKIRLVNFVASESKANQSRVN